MQPLAMVLLESTLTFGVPLGLAVAELIHLNRPTPPPPGDRPAHPPPRPPQMAPPAARHREVQPVRELEDA